MEDFPHTPEDATKKLNKYLAIAGKTGRFASRLNEDGEPEFVKDRGFEQVIYSAQAALGLIELADTLQKNPREVVVYESPELKRRNKKSRKKAPSDSRRVTRGPGRYSSKPVN